MSSVRNSTLEGPIVIGSRVSIIKSQIERYTYLASSSSVINASIGPFCSIAHGVYIGLANHPVHGISTSPIFYSNLKQLGVSWRDQAAVVESLPVSIGADVWIGANALIKGGVKIGVGAVIGAGAVVVNDVPDFAIVGGVPAKLIRYRFPVDQQNIILESKWWNLPEEKLKNRIDNWEDPVAFLDGIH